MLYLSLIFFIIKLLITFKVSAIVWRPYKHGWNNGKTTATFKQYFASPSYQTAIKAIRHTSLLYQAIYVGSLSLLCWWTIKPATVSKKYLLGSLFSSTNCSKYVFHDLVFVFSRSRGHKLWFEFLNVDTIDKFWKIFWHLFKIRWHTLTSNNRFHIVGILLERKLLFCQWT